MPTRLVWAAILSLFAAEGCALAACSPAYTSGPEDLTSIRADLGPGSNGTQKIVGMKALRVSSWSLFTRVTAPVPGCEGRAVWRSWRNEVQTYAPPSQQFALMPHAEGESQPDIKAPKGMWESAYFNPFAYRHIQAAMREFPAIAPLRRREIAEFPPGSIVVKAFWRKITPGEPPIKVGLWDWSLGTGDIVVEDLFPSSVRVGLVQSAGVLDARSNFFTVGAADAVGDGFVCKGPDEACTPAKKGDVFILVALHIITKELPDWRWATFWWKGVDRKDGEYWTCDNAQRPNTLPSPWDHYSMDTTISFSDKPTWSAAYPQGGCAVPPLGVSPAAYNPFIEAALTNGTRSTCIDCHSRARNEHQVPRFFIPAKGDLTRYPRLSDFEGFVRTDYLWSVARFFTPSQ